MISLTAQERNRQLVRDAFARWAIGQGSVFDLLADDATWTIAGSGHLARTWRGRQAYIDAAVTPLVDRLATATIPCVLGIWADADEVIVRWKQDTPTKAGGHYRNSYAWFLTVHRRKVTAVTAFLDLAAYQAVVGEPTAHRQSEPADPSGVLASRSDKLTEHKERS